MHMIARNVRCYLLGTVESRRQFLCCVAERRMAAKKPVHHLTWAVWDAHERVQKATTLALYNTVVLLRASGLCSRVLDAPAVLYGEIQNRPKRRCQTKYTGLSERLMQRLQEVVLSTMQLGARAKGQGASANERNGRGIRRVQRRECHGREKVRSGKNVRSRRKSPPQMRPTRRERTAPNEHEAEWTQQT